MHGAETVGSPSRLRDARPSDEWDFLPPKVTVVGCGNWLHPSDRIGSRVLQQLSGRLERWVALEDVGTSLLGLLDHLHGQELLILVDACIGRGAPGTVHVVEPDLDAAPPARPSAHQIGPLETLIIGRELYPERFPRQLLWVLLETGGLEREAEQPACHRVVREIESLINEWRAGRRRGATTQREGRT